jgi:hypothetical protein
MALWRLLNRGGRIGVAVFATAIIALILCVVLTKVVLPGRFAAFDVTRSAMPRNDRFGYGIYDNTTLSASEAREIVQRGERTVIFQRLNDLSAAAAKELAAIPDEMVNLSLDGLTVISADAARELAKCRCQSLSLSGLTELQDDVAIALATYRGSPTWGATLHLDGIKNLSIDAAKGIAAFPNDVLSLRGLEIDRDTGMELASVEGQWLFLGGLRAPSRELAAVIASFRCSAIDLGKVIDLKPSAATALAQFQGKVLAMELVVRSEEILAALNAFRGKLEIRNEG